jgi:hypothetical protein
LQKLLIYLEIQQHFLCVQNVEISIRLLDYLHWIQQWMPKDAPFLLEQTMYLENSLVLHDEVKLSS